VDGEPAAGWAGTGVAVAVRAPRPAVWRRCRIGTYCDTTGPRRQPPGGRPRNTREHAHMASDVFRSERMHRPRVMSQELTPQPRQRQRRVPGVRGEDMRRLGRIGRILKWAGLVLSLLIVVAWAASLYWELAYFRDIGVATAKTPPFYTTREAGLLCSLSMGGVGF
jgi:hypothetical protein